MAICNDRRFLYVLIVFLETLNGAIADTGMIHKFYCSLDLCWYVCFVSESANFYHRNDFQITHHNEVKRYILTNEFSMIVTEDEL